MEKGEIYSSGLDNKLFWNKFYLDRERPLGKKDIEITVGKNRVGDYIRFNSYEINI